jgi:hypothetical protein
MKYCLRNPKVSILDLEEPTRFLSKILNWLSQFEKDIYQNLMMINMDLINRSFVNEQTVLYQAGRRKQFLSIRTLTSSYSISFPAQIPKQKLNF